MTSENKNLSTENSVKTTRKKFLKYAGLGVLATGTVGTGVFSYMNIIKISALNNMLKMGHCAPTVMKTLLDVDGTYDEKIVKLAGSLAGGIGTCGAECGGITAGIIFLGLKNMKLNQIIPIGKKFMKEFNDYNHFVNCKERPKEMQSCIKAISSSPGKVIKLNKMNTAGISEAYQTLLDAFSDHKFHCAKEVFNCLKITDPKIMNACQGFIGGTLLSGMTCSALTAGVMAIGLYKGEIENSYLKVIHMIRIMDDGDEWMRNEINNFHRSMNLANNLTDWFVETYNTSQCNDITGCPFRDKKELQGFIKKDGFRRCRAIAKNVAQKIEELV